MSYSYSIKRFRIESVLKNFSSSVFLTLTTPDYCDLCEIRKRWRAFRHSYFRASRFNGVPNYLMIYEPHPKGHGWHIHVVIEKAFAPIDIIRLVAMRSGFGRVHIERLKSGERIACYLSKYLFKAVRSAKTLGVSRVRLVNLSRGLTRLCDCVSDDSFTRTCRYLVANKLPSLQGLTPIHQYKFVMAYLMFGRVFSEPIDDLDNAIKNIDFPVAFHPLL